MSGNTFGRLFRVTTFGESHGIGMGCIIDGCPPGLALSETDIQPDLDRRRPGRSDATSPRDEADRVEIRSGVFEGATTGTPIGLWIANQDQRSGDYGEVRDKIRPSHADYTYLQKYGRRDYRGGGRASARETVMRVAAGAVARKYLAECSGIEIRARLAGFGGVQLDAADWKAVDQNEFFSADPARLGELRDRLAELRDAGDSVGALVEVEALGVPVGLGEPVFDKLDSALAGALMGINAVKAVEIGEGFGAAAMRGSEYRDEIGPEGFAGNTAGGTLGGISSGQPIVARIALKPTSSIRRPGRTLSTAGEPVEISVQGRHDPCVGIRAVPVAEAMVALVLMDMLLRQRGQNADVVPPMPPLAGDRR